MRSGPRAVSGIHNLDFSSIGSRVGSGVGYRRGSFMTISRVGSVVPSVHNPYLTS
jgi:hypothetical protein